MKQRTLSGAIQLAALGAALGIGVAGTAQAGLVNGSFEALSVGMPSESYIITDASNVPGWRTTAADNMIEVWESPGPDEAPTLADDGNRFAELNANLVSTLYQDVAGIQAGNIVGWQLSHRGREGEDSMGLTITDLGTDGMFNTGDDTVLVNQVMTDGNTAWGHYAGTGIVALGNTVRFAFDSVSAATGEESFGNFLDAADFGVGVGVTPVPEPSVWAMFAAGLLATAGAARRARRS